ncbi:MAG: riboflavin synthase [Saprospiraceae bacterium]|nr:riboflavin synthase [Saprospiraceae bacterium]
MFTGIVENVVRLTEMENHGSNVTFTFSCLFVSELYIDQSISHNGVCLTVVFIDGNIYKVTAINETLEKTNLKNLKIGDKVNVERSLRPDSYMDGHFVQGHVDKTMKCSKITEENGSWFFYFLIEKADESLLVNKGSVCINGVSLTVVHVGNDEFSVAIIPYTFENTTFKSVKVGDLVNIEFDIFGKYIVNYLSKLVKT